MTDPTVCVLVPFRPTYERGCPRAELAHWTSTRLRREHPTWGIVRATGPDRGPFNRSAAINEAAAIADRHPLLDRPADVLVIADSDSFVAADQLRSAVEIAHATGRLTFAFERFASLDAAMTGRVMGGYEGSWEPGVAWDVHGSCSSMVVVPKSLWTAVDGFDPGFVGWGFEDVAFSLACQSLGPAGGPPFHRVAGTVWHLHHPPAPATGDSSHPLWQANQQRAQRYIDAWGQGREAMELLIYNREARA